MSESLLPPGNYKARAVEAGLGYTNDGNPQVAVHFSIIDSEGPYHGRDITWFGSFSKTRGQGKYTPFERLIMTLRTCGWDGNDLDDLSGVDANEVNLKVEHDEYKGEVRAKVAFVGKVGGLALKTPMTPEQAKAFASKMRGEVIAASKGSAAAAGNGGKKPHPNAPGASTGAPPRDESDEIPF